MRVLFAVVAATFASAQLPCLGESFKLSAAVRRDYPKLGSTSKDNPNLNENKWEAEAAGRAAVTAARLSAASVEKRDDAKARRRASPPTFGKVRPVEVGDVKVRLTMTAQAPC